MNPLNWLSGWAGWLHGVLHGIPFWLLWPLASVLLLFLAAGLTPRRWWRHPTLLAGLAIIGGGYLLARLAVPLANGPTPVMAQASVPATGDKLRAATGHSGPDQLAPSGATPLVSGTPGPGGFRVHQPLNLRRAAGTDGAWLVTLPAGTRVWPTGRRAGDWWQVVGAGHTGWVNSLWLRQIGEGVANR